MMVSYGLCWTLWTLSCFAQCLGQTLPLPELTNGAIGESAVLAPNRPPFNPSDLISIQWDFENKIIIRITLEPSNVLTAPEYIGRVNVNTTTLALELKNLRLNDSGTYDLSILTTSVEQHRGKTKLEVYEKVSNVTLIGPKESLIEGESYANITSAGSGNITSVQWMRDNNPLIPSSSITFLSDNRSVLINPVFKSDSGVYQCSLRNPVSFETAKLTLIVNYGPENVSIKGPNEVGLGHPLSLFCSAGSEPSASFTWKFNGTDSNVTTETFTIEKSDFTHSGDYICTARNNVTNRSVSQSHSLVVKEGGGGGEGGEGGGLTTGAIVGIVIGSLVAVAGICGLIAYLTKTKKIPKVTLGKSGPANETPRIKQQTDLDYAYISHESQASGKGVNLEKMNESSTEYAQIKHEASDKPRSPTAV